MTLQRAPTRSGQRILVAPVLVDDFGNAVYRCRFTDALVWPEDGRYVGSFMESVSGVYVVHVNSKEQERAERRLFDESEANCNTCRQLVRIPSEKRNHAPFAGTCAKRPDGFSFWPQDPMHMTCYVPRWATE